MTELQSILEMVPDRPERHTVELAINAAYTAGRWDGMMEMARCERQDIQALVESSHDAAFATYSASEDCRRVLSKRLFSQNEGGK